MLKPTNAKELTDIELAVIILDTEHHIIGEGNLPFLQRWSDHEKRLAEALLIAEKNLRQTEKALLKAITELGVQSTIKMRATWGLK